MNYLYSLVLAVHILVGLAVIGLVLLQHGKGADMGAAFGSGASGSLFGASGSANFLSRTTAILAASFFLTSLGLSYLASSRPHESSSVMDKALQSQTTEKSAVLAPADVPTPKEMKPEAGSEAAKDAPKEEVKGAAKDIPAETSKADAGKDAAKPTASKDSVKSGDAKSAVKDSPVKDIPK